MSLCFVTSKDAYCGRYMILKYKHKNETGMLNNPYFTIFRKLKSKYLENILVDLLKYIE